MQAICLSLPVRPDLADSVSLLLELGFETQPPRQHEYFRNGGNYTPRSGYPETTTNTSLDHLRVLTEVLRDHLLGIKDYQGGVWMEKRELADFLGLLECGLTRLAHRYPASDKTQDMLTALSELLGHIHVQVGIRRKPMQRQPSPRARTASAVGT